MDTLNRNELETLRILWEKGELKPGQIQEAFGWEIENPTLRSVLVNLVEKGHITRDLRGKAFFYSVKVPKATLFQSMIKGVARVFTKGSYKDLVTQLVETGDITADDLAALKKAARQPSRKKRKL